MTSVLWGARVDIPRYIAKFAATDALRAIKVASLPGGPTSCRPPVGFFGSADGSVTTGRPARLMGEV